MPSDPNAVSSPARRVVLITFILAAVVGATVFYHISHRDRWQTIEFPQDLKRDGNRANVVLVDRRNKILGLAALGVTWSPTESWAPTTDGWVVTVSAADRVAELPMAGGGPALLVSIPGAQAERFALSPAGFDSLVAALERAETADPWAPIDSPSVVDVVRDNYSGPDKPRLLQLLTRYKTIVLTPAEREALSRRPGGG